MTSANSPTASAARAKLELPLFIIVTSSELEF
jgi:hypothetical protein